MVEIKFKSKEKEQEFIEQLKMDIAQTGEEIEIIEETKEKPLINKMAKHLKSEGFACVSQGQSNGERNFCFLHKETGEYFTIGDNYALDEEELWNMLGTTEEEISKEIEERNKTEDCYTGAEMDNKVGNWEDEDYKAVIQDLITSNEEVIKDE